MSNFHYPEDDFRLLRHNKVIDSSVCYYPNCNKPRINGIIIRVIACVEHKCKCTAYCDKPIIYDRCYRSTCVKCYATIKCVCKCKSCDKIHPYISVKNFDDTKLPDDLLNLIIYFAGLQVINCPIFKFF